jgi:pimeloyl-ACP methyl ester carboxylesterase
VLALTAANQLHAKVDGVVMFEPPFIVDDSRPPVGQPFVDQLTALLHNRDHTGATKHFMRNAIGMPAAMVAMMRLFPGWKKMTAMAPTLPYDLAVMGDSQRGQPLPTDRWQNVDVPTLVITGGKSKEFFHTGAQQLVRSLRNGQHLRLEKANHAAVVAPPKRVAETIVSFLASTQRSHSSTNGI